jgi:glycosyltransferase involved in cell wall biosynthesis
VERSRIGIVIPALNEAATIAAVVSNACQYGMPIVVDDGSSDKTGELAATAGATVVRHEVNRGYDQALNSGFARADELGCEYVVTMDADGQHDPAILAPFIRALDEGADVVVGIRDHHQRLAEHIFAWLGFAKWGIRDPLCGMKAYRIIVYKTLGHFDSNGSIGTELAIYAAKSGRNIAQLPVKTRERFDAPRFGRRFSANMRLLRALWNEVVK